MLAGIIVLLITHLSRINNDGQSSLFPIAPRPHKLLVDLKYIVSTDYDLIAGAQYELGRGQI